MDLAQSARPGSSTETRIQRTGRKVLNFMYFCSVAGKLTLPTQESIIRCAASACFALACPTSTGCTPAMTGAQQPCEPVLKLCSAGRERRLLCPPPPAPGRLGSAWPCRQQTMTGTQGHSWGQPRHQQGHAPADSIRQAVAHRQGWSRHALLLRCALPVSSCSSLAQRLGMTFSRQRPQSAWRQLQCTQPAGQHSSWPGGSLRAAALGIPHQQPRCSGSPACCCRSPRR